ncbi:PAS domain S-box protein [Gemmatimonadota bacterium]
MTKKKPTYEALEERIRELEKVEGNFILDNKRLQEKVEELKMLWHANFESSVLIDTDGIIIEANEAFADKLGKKPEDTIGQNVYSLFPADLAKSRREIVQQVIETGKPIRREDQRGHTWFDNCIRPVLENTGQVKSIAIVGSDISERKRAEEALRESEEKLREILNQSSIVIYVKDIEGRYLLINRKYEKLFHISNEKIIGKTDYDIFPKESADTFRENDLEALQSDSPLESEEVVPQDDGPHTYISVKFKLKKLDGIPYAVCGISTDITERKQVEATLQESEQRYRALFESSADGILIVDIDTKEFKYVNPAICKMLGYSEKELKGMGVRDIHPKNSLDHVLSEFKAQARNKKTLAQNIPCLRKDGKVIYADFNTTTVLIDKRNCNIGFVRDITERMQLEDERKKAAKLESVGVLAGGIAHDFNNILSVILGNVSLAKMFMMKDKGPASESLTDAEAACGRARDLTQQLLTFSKGGAPVKKTASLSVLLKEASEFALSGSNVKCRHYISNVLWPCAVDEGQINQVIHNLLINADQAMSEGGTISIHAVNVTVGKEDRLPLNEGKYVKLTIKDQGIGISKEHLSKIFDPYFSTKKKGHGLGLATTYSIIKRHGGHITVESELKVGTTFHLYLPASSEKVLEKEETKEEAIVIKGKILVMDDDKAVRTALSKMLRLLGLEVESAENGEETIELYRNAMASEKPFDAVILDLTIRGGMGGKVTIKRLLEIDPHVKAIVSSGYSNDPVMADPGKHGFCSVVSKPYRIDELREVLQSVLKEKSG